VERKALTRPLIDEHGLVLPETLVDQDRLPHARRWLREQPLVCVSGATWSRLAECGVRVFRVAFNATGDRMLDIEGIGGGGPSVSLVLSVDALQQAFGTKRRGTSKRGAGSAFDADGNPSAIDRVMRLVSGGVLDESVVLNAFDARRLIEDGYGYRGAVEGTFVSVDHIATELRGLDAIFGQILRRAKPMRRDGERFLAAVADASRDAVGVNVPIYGTARRIIIPELRLSGVERLVIAGESLHSLDVPSERRWHVRGVAPWTPQLPAALDR
jgi:hypothetical protein